MGLGSAACEWQGHKKPLLPVSVEVSKETVRVSDRTGSVLRCFGLGSLAHLDVVLSDNRHRRAALLKGSKEYDLVRNGRIPGCKLFNVSLTVSQMSPLSPSGAFF